MKLQSLVLSANVSVQTVGTARSECVFWIPQSLRYYWEQRDVFKIHIRQKHKTKLGICIKNFVVSKVCSVIPAFMSHSTSLFQSISLTLEISSSHWSTSSSDWLLHMFVCCLLWLERQSLSTFDVRTVCDLKWEHRHWWMSQLTYPFFSVIGGSSYQTVGNKIIIKDICCGDSTFIIAQASIKPSSLVHARPTMS